MRRLFKAFFGIGLFALIALLAILTGLLGLAGSREREVADRVAPVAGLFVSLPGGRIFTQQYGPANGHAVIFVHGTAAWSGFWAGTAERVGKAGFRAIAIDLPPFGFSDRDPQGRYSRSAQAERLIALAASIGRGKPVTIVGHSFGAGPVLEAVMRRPELFGRLVLVSGALALPEEGETPGDGGLAGTLLGLQIPARLVTAATMTNPWATRQFLALMLERKEAATDAIADVLRRPLVVAGTTEAYARWVPNLFVPDVKAQSGKPEALRNLSVPTSIIWGREDSVTPLAQAERLRLLVPGATLDVIDGIGHIPHLEAPERFMQLLLPRLN